MFVTKTFQRGICELGDRCKRAALRFGQVFDQRDKLVTKQAWHQPLQLPVAERVQPFQRHFQGYFFQIVSNRTR